MSQESTLRMTVPPPVIPLNKLNEPVPPPVPPPAPLMKAPTAPSKPAIAVVPKKKERRMELEGLEGWRPPIDDPSDKAGYSKCSGHFADRSSKVWMGNTCGAVRMDCARLLQCF